MSDHLIPTESIPLRSLSWIGELRQFINDKGLSIQQVIATDVDGQSCGMIPRNCRWRSQCNIVLQTPQGNVPHQFAFSYEAADITEAFAIWEAEAGKAVPIELKRLQAEATKQGLLQGVRRDGFRSGKG
jgi:hypothetical protein